MSDPDFVYRVPTDGPFMGWGEVDIRAWWDGSLERFAAIHQTVLSDAIAGGETPDKGYYLPSIAEIAGMFGAIGKAQAARVALGIERVHVLTGAGRDQLAVLLRGYREGGTISGREPFTVQVLPPDGRPHIVSVRAIWTDGTADEWVEAGWQNYRTPTGGRNPLAN